ncbi:hypothetical protein DM02DRAFT_725222 [Periconia macrospinosa]|uniref:Uncharacterized protein n=1 Tax=Periconia macrospinosa TaxID=97972 RepID=A0A2V1E4I1_9PLEO|nr:hypothetical protein DM02DRAFT_725222 [Periconia macrospinosa]
MLTRAILMLYLLTHANINSRTSAAAEPTLTSSLLFSTVVTLAIATFAVMRIHCSYAATQGSRITHLASNLLPTSPTALVMKTARIVLLCIKDHPIHHNNLELSGSKMENKPKNNINNDGVNKQHTTTPTVSLDPTKRYPKLSKARTPRHVRTHLPLHDISDGPTGGLDSRWPACLQCAIYSGPIVCIIRVIRPFILFLLFNSIKRWRSERIVEFG